MKQAISITASESENIETLFSTYNSYMGMLEYLSNSVDVANSPIFDKKWNEAVELAIKLDKAKRQVEVKYKPEGDWDRYEFNFDKQQVIFTKDE